jgi:hypothetical protein
MSEKISEVTEVLNLADEDLFALAMYTGAGPTGYASRSVSYATVKTELGTELTGDTTFVTNVSNELSQSDTFITDVVENLIENSTYINNVNTGLRTTVEEETGTTYTLELADAEHKWKTFTNVSPITVTIPPQADVAWPDNTYIELHAGSTGAVTIAAGSGVTLNINEYLTSSLYGRDAVAALKRIGTNEWVLFGNLEPV